MKKSIVDKILWVLMIFLVGIGYCYGVNILRNKHKVVPACDDTILRAVRGHLFNDTLFTATQVLVEHDTLVYIVEKDSVRWEQKDFPAGSTIYISGSGWECCYPADGNRFKDGKTKDTIHKHETVYYK